MTHLGIRRASVVAASCAAVALALPVAGCGDTGGRSTSTRAATVETQAGPPPTTTPADPQPRVLTPDLVGINAADVALIEGYLGWTRLAKPPIPALRSLGGAHAGAKRIFTSATRGALVRGGAQRFPYPRGTVVVKEARTDGVVTLVAIMEKVRANDGSTGGWRYREYNRASGGEPFTRVSFPESGCASCHMNARSRQATDWVFSSLR